MCTLICPLSSIIRVSVQPTRASARHIGYCRAPISWARALNLIKALAAVQSNYSFPPKVWTETLGILLKDSHWMPADGAKKWIDDTCKLLKANTHQRQ